MKLYLSGPMSGIQDFNAPEFQAAARHLRELGHDIVSPVEEDEADGIITTGMSGDLKDLPVTWADLISRDVKLIADGTFDGIIMLPNWTRSKGAKLELALALILGLSVFSYDPKTRELRSVRQQLAAESLKECIYAEPFTR